MNLEPLKEGMSVFDTDMPHIGEGTILTIEDDIVEVQYKDIEEIVEYSINEANKHLHILL